MRQNVESLQTKGKQQAVDGPKIVPSGHSIQQLRFMFKGLHVTVSNNGLHAMEKNTAETCFAWNWYVQNGLILSI